MCSVLTAGQQKASVKALAPNQVADGIFWLSEQSLLELFSNLASDRNCSREVETGLLAQSSRPCSPLLTCFPFRHTLSYLCLTLPTLTHPILLINQPCSPFLTETDFLKLGLTCDNQMQSRTPFFFTLPTRLVSGAALQVNKD